MKKSLFLLLVFAGSWLAMPPGLRAKGHGPTSGKSTALVNTTVLIIRHAEKPDTGDGLSPAGVAHAAAYGPYFQNYSVNGAGPIRLTALFAAADSSSSHRPSLTLLPLSQATGLPIDTGYKDKDYAKLADALQSSDHGAGILICWHHGKLPDLVRALGGDPHEIIPQGKWPGDQYGWVVQLSYDEHGHLKASKLVVENL